MKKYQRIIGFILIIAMLFFGSYLHTNKEGPVRLFLFTGLLLGYILTRSQYGFAGGVKRIWVTGDGSLTKALLVMFAISIIGTAGIHLGAAMKGALPAMLAAEGDAVIPGTGFVAPADLAVVIGGFIFGIGMIFGGGCASGTLTDTGEGQVRGWITLLFFAIGGIIGHAMLPGIDKSFLRDLSLGTVYLPDLLGGYLGAVLVSLLGLVVLYTITRKYEDKRRAQGTFEEIVFLEEEKPLKEKEFKLFSEASYHKFFVERWSFITGGVLIAMMFIFILTTTGSSWGASGPYTMWGVWLFEKFGIKFTSPAFEGIVKTVNAGLMNQTVSMRNIGMILGSTIAVLLAGRFKFDINFGLKDAFYYALGGLAMGVGAKIAGGCNIGALYSGIANFSLSGWLFLVSIVPGGIFGLTVFQGKMNMIPNRRDK